MAAVAADATTDDALEAMLAKQMLKALPVPPKPRKKTRARSRELEGAPTP
eukprot:SAG11_NODE_21549_length_423_cov_0.753086_1_plen_49_part_10